MALLFFDGFENYNEDADVIAIRNPAISSITPTSWTYGALGRRSSRGVGGIHDRTMQYTFVNNYASFVVGIAIYRNSLTVPTYVAGYPLFGFYDGTTLQLGFYVVGTEIHVYSNGIKLGETSGADISYQTWRYVEVKFTIHNSAGAVEIHVDGVQRMTPLADQDTQVSANAYFNIFEFKGLCISVWAYYDDLYMCDLTGTKNNDFLGDVRVDVLRPDGAGTYTQFTPSAGTNWENVDEVYPDDDTSYNQGSNVGDKDTYALAALPAPAGTTIHGVKSQITVRKTDAGARECKLLTRSGSTDDLGDTVVLSDSYLTPTKIYENNPDDSLAWEDADVNAMEVGVQITV